MQAATIDAADWWARPRGEHTQSWIANYQNSLAVRHRTLISQIVGALQPASVLEIGCHCGPNLIRLATDHPGLRCFGMDVNPSAIQAGQDWAARVGLKERIAWRVGRFPEDTDGLSTGSVDVVLTCYAIGAYMAKEDLVAALYELGRLAKRAVILAEPMATGETDSVPAINGYVEWHHDYHQAVQWVSTLNTRRQRRVPVDPPVDALREILVLETV